MGDAPRTPRGTRRIVRTSCGAQALACIRRPASTRNSSRTASVEAIWRWWRRFPYRRILPASVLQPARGVGGGAAARTWLSGPRPDLRLRSEPASETASGEPPLRSRRRWAHRSCQRSAAQTHTAGPDRHRTFCPHQPESRLGRRLQHLPAIRWPGPRASRNLKRRARSPARTFAALDRSLALAVGRHARMVAVVCPCGAGP
jgi:hypothetical protein